MHKINTLANFLAEHPLFTPFKAVEGYVRTSTEYTDPLQFKGVAFSFYCDVEQDRQTFELELPNSTSNHFANMPGHVIPNELFDNKDRLNFTQHLIGRCRSCKKYHVDFLLHVFSDNVIPKDTNNTTRKDPATGEYLHTDHFQPDRANIFITKLGAPPTKIKLEKSIEKYLDRESGNWYYKSKKSLTDNLGIGAFAYLRRIIEKELMSIAKDVSELEGADPKMKAVIAKHSLSSTPHLVYDDIFEYLPKSLQVLGDNPFKLLYSHTSEALHRLSENECLERAKHIELLFEFVIRKIYEERSELLTVKQAIKSLKELKTNQNQ